MAGELDTVFRRQLRATVKAGGTLRTALGVLDIVSVEQVALDDITDDDARRAGMDGRGAVIVALQAKPDGDDYRVCVRPGGADLRIVLRESAEFGEVELDELRARLDRLDARSAHGPWTRTVLALIGEQPHVRAPDLAASLGRDTPSFKQDVRKLKALGLTIGHSPGYELSPRGRAALARI